MEDNILDLEELYITPDFISEVLELTIKKDRASKLITFYCMLSAFISESAFNVAFIAPSSTGKSYIPSQVVSLFPSEIVIKVAYYSPTAFYHQNGKYDKERDVVTVDLENKIILFQDLHSINVIQNLRPLLSHDEKVLKYSITNKNNKVGLKAKNIEIIGFPAVIFCSVNTTIDEQESSRFIMLSPEMNQEKIVSGIELKILKEAAPEKFQQLINENADRKILIDRIRKVQKAKIKEVEIKDADIKYINEAFINKRKVLKPKHQRDIARLLSLVKSIALSNFMLKDKTGINNIVADLDDIDNALSLLNEVSKSQELNLPPFIYDIYWEVIVPTFLIKKENTNKVGLTREEVSQAHLRIKHTTLDPLRFRQQVIPVLKDNGLVNEVRDKIDRRTKLLVPLMLDEEEIYNREYSEKTRGDENIK